MNILKFEPAHPGGEQMQKKLKIPRMTQNGENFRKQINILCATPGGTHIYIVKVYIWVPPCGAHKILNV